MPKRLRHRHVELPPHTTTYAYHHLEGWYPSYAKPSKRFAVKTWRVTACYLDVKEEFLRAAPTVVGLAFCAPGDNFSYAIGRAIARGRAQQALTDLLCRQLGSPRVHITAPALSLALSRVRWPLGTAVICSDGFRLDKPLPMPLNPVFQKALLTGEIGRVENVRFVSIDDESTKPAEEGA